MEGFDHTRGCLYKRRGSSSSYQEDFLAIFKLTEWDGPHISRVVDRIVERFGGEEWFGRMLKKSPFFDPDDPSASLAGLFNYDQLDILYAILSRAISGEGMSGDGVDNLVKRLELK